MCKWIVDADQLQLSNFESNIIYRNTLVNSYLNNDTILGIEAPKGLGKTFLIKCKRKKSQDRGIMCLPYDSMCDILDKVTFQESMYSYLEDYSNWIDLWKISICLSIIKSSSLQAEVLTELLASFPEEHNVLFNQLYKSSFVVTPCQIMNQLINSNRNLVRMLQCSIPTLIASIKTINQPIHIFIDKTDQALRDNLHFINGATKVTRGPNNNSYWSYGQVALAEAAYNIFTQNQHIKVYFSIRSEAMMGAESYTNLFLQIRSYITKLEYDYNELLKMFNHYIDLESEQYLVAPELKNISREKAFIGVDFIPHGYVKDLKEENVRESFFQYLFRHTLKRPRDVMHICYRLCYSNIRELKNEEDRYKEIRHIVNKESRLILQAYLREMGPFVFDRYPEQWDHFWHSLETNVFTINYARAICNDINNATQEGKTFCDKNCVECGNFKPFSSLYNTGLLGIVTKNNVENSEPIISFLGTGNVIINTDENLLPSSDLYFLHPMLTNKIESERRGKGLHFDVCKRLVVGHGQPVKDEHYLSITSKELERFNRVSTNSIFLSSTCFDLHDYRKMIFKELRNYDYSVIMSERNDFGTPNITANSYDFCLDKVLKCKRMIFIIGERYGGVYKGEKYLEEAKEIGQISDALREPSISLMEFYLAHKNKIDTYVFVKKDIYNERISYEKNKHIGIYNPTFVKDNRVFDIVSFITRLPKGNWLKTFEDLPDLLEIIKIQFSPHNDRERQ